jgi:diguanylate cyclase (GGDEF)-like protein
MSAEDRPEPRQRYAVAALVAYYVIATAITVAALAGGRDPDPLLSWAFNVGTMATWGVLGAIGLWQRPGDRAVRAFAVAGVAVAATIWVGYLDPLLLPDSRPAMVRVPWRLLNIVVYFGTFPLLIELGASVPRRNALVRRHPMLLRGNYALAAAIVATLTLLFALPLPHRFDPLLDRLGARVPLLNQLLYLYSGAFILALLLSAARRERSALGRRQILVVFLGVLPWTTFQALPPALRPAVLESLTNLLAAFAFFVAVLGLQLFELGVLLRRSVIAAVTLAALTLAGFAGWAGLAGLTARVLAPEARIWEVTLIVAAIGFAFRPLAREVARGLDRLFFVEKLALAKLEHDLPPDLAGETDLGIIARRLVSQLRAALHLESAGLLLGDDEEQLYRTVALEVRNRADLGTPAVVSSAELGDLGLDEGGCAALATTNAAPAALRRWRPRVWCPIHFRARLLGALWLGASRTGWRPDGEDRARLERIVQTASTVLESARLFRQATFDPLTGLPRRETLVERLRRELDRCRRSYRPLLVGLADLDDFKKLNDTWGHAVGDQALIAVAQTLREGSRGTDLIGRYGGEEFLLVLPETDLDAGIALVERLRAEVAAIPPLVQDDHQAQRLTLSVGVARVEPADLDRDLDQLLERADRALYSAKRAGKDRIVVAAAGEAATVTAGGRRGRT